MILNLFFHSHKSWQWKEITWKSEPELTTKGGPQIVRMIEFAWLLICSKSKNSSLHSLYRVMNYFLRWNSIIDVTDVKCHIRGTVPSRSLSISMQLSQTIYPTHLLICITQCSSHCTAQAAITWQLIIFLSESFEGSSLGTVNTCGPHGKRWNTSETHIVDMPKMI